MEQTISFSLAGCGRIGQRHAALMARFGRVAAVCDIEKERAQELAGKYQCPAFVDFEEMLQQAKSDVVVIATPNYLHAPQTISALQAGSHVLCEKPMAIHPADAAAMAKAASACGKVLMVVKQNRFNPPVMAVKKLLNEGGLGRIFSAQLNGFWNRDDAYYQSSWKGSLARDGGTLYTQFSHFVDLLHWFLGPMQPVAVQLANYMHQDSIEFEDTGAALLTFGQGGMATLQYTVNAYHQNMEGSITLFGEKGTVKIGGQYLNLLEYQQWEGDPLTDIPTGNPANDYGRYQGSMSNHPQVYQNLLDVINHNAPMVSDLQDAQATVQTIAAIYALGRGV